MLHDTVERILIGSSYADEDRGIFVIRGENVTLLGEINQDKEKDMISGLELVEFSDAKKMQKEKADISKQRRYSDSVKLMATKGFSGSNFEY